MGITAWKTFQFRHIHGAMHARKRTAAAPAAASIFLHRNWRWLYHNIQMAQNGKNSRSVELVRAIAPQRKPNVHHSRMEYCRSSPGVSPVPRARSASTNTQVKRKQLIDIS